jgi:hypothetical protein
MNIAMSFLLPAFAMVLAPLAQGQSTPPQPKITGVLTILTPKAGATVEQVMKIMPAEIRATVSLYLDGKIQQWFTRGDSKGVIFLLNCTDVAEARALIENLPLWKETSWTSSSFRSGHSCRSEYYCEIARPTSELALLRPQFSGLWCDTAPGQTFPSIQERT